MIRLNFLLFIVLFSIAACSNSKTVPSTILAPDKMQAVLWDMFRAGNFVSSFQYAADTSLNRTKEQLKWYNRVLYIHQVTEAQFKESVKYYKSHPALLSTIMDSLSKKGLTPVVKPVPEIKSVQ